MVQLRDSECACRGGDRGGEQGGPSSFAINPHLPRPFFVKRKRNWLVPLVEIRGPLDLRTPERAQDEVADRGHNLIGSVAGAAGKSASMYHSSKAGTVVKALASELAAICTSQYLAASLIAPVDQAPVFT